MKLDDGGYPPHGPAWRSSHARRKARGARRATVHGGIDEDVPFVQADPQKIGWVLGQLIDNGIKFTPAGGSVVAQRQARRRQPGHRSPSPIPGIGIPPDRLNEIFEPFHQLDGSSTRRYGGTGLGLSLVRQIVEAHGSHDRCAICGRERIDLQVPPAGHGEEPA
ncbi:MAG: ATP-binding protein [Candidatus Moduliflexus flocculans]|nr:ATP-binding protein [Candidatus Moduliflexus flocculans]